jgi:hypothetical protein
MNHLEFMEIDQHVDFSFSSCFDGLIFPIHPFHTIFIFFAYMHQMV